METKSRSGWAAAMIVLAVLVGLMLVLWLVAPLVGIFD